MKKLLLILLVTFTCYCSCSRQISSISDGGKVFLIKKYQTNSKLVIINCSVTDNKSAIGIPQATLRILNTNIGAISDEKGNLIAKFDTGYHNFIIDALLFNHAEFNLKVNRGDSIIIKAKLQSVEGITH